MKDIIYLKIEVPKDNEETDKIREAGLFFEEIADALYLERENIIEIDETNYESICKEIENQFEKYINRRESK